MSYTEKAYVIIPARNEAPRIQPVIEAAQAADPSLIHTEHVIVVDNNSTDSTQGSAFSMGAEVINCMQVGKGWAMQAGVERARRLGATTVTFLDADLIGLRPDHVNRLVEPIVEGKAVMNIGYLGGRRALLKSLLKYWGAFSGQRTVSLPDVWDYLCPTDLKNWRTEGVLNAVARNRGVGKLVLRTELEDLRHVGTREKEANLAIAGIRYIQKYGSATQGLLSHSGK